jgi:hypothetical protein
MTRSSTALFVALAVAACSAAACSPNSDAPSTAPVGSTPGEGMGAATVQDFRTGVNIKDLMAHVIDYNAFEVWHRQGWIIGDSVVELFPVDDDGWHAAESAAFTVAEASNLLLMPGRPLDDDRRWVDYSHQLYDAAMTAQAAALARDKDAFFNAGTDMYRACVACHTQYIQGQAVGKALPELPGRAPPPPNQ